MFELEEKYVLWRKPDFMLKYSYQNDAWEYSTYKVNITMTSRWRLKLPASRLFTQAFIQAQIKENIKAPRHGPLCVCVCVWGGGGGGGIILRTNGQ